MIYRITQYNKETKQWEVVTKGPKPGRYSPGKARIFDKIGYAKNSLNGLQRETQNILERNPDWNSPIYRIEQSESDWKPYVN